MHMKVIYLDELFLLNLVIDYFLLLATARICSLPFRRIRFAVAAALGSLWNCVSLYPALTFLQSPLMHPVLAAAMSLIAFDPRRHLWRCLLAFLGVSALFGGTVWAAGLYRGVLSQGTLIHMDMRILLFSFALCWALISLVFRRSVPEAARVIHLVTITRNGQTVTLRALDDTGNGLFDPLSGCAVLVAEPDSLAPLFPRGEARFLSLSPTDAMLRMTGMRLVPCTDIGGKSRLLLAFRPDGITVDGAVRNDLTVAAAPAPLGGNGSYQAIL